MEIWIVVYSHKHGIDVWPSIKDLSVDEVKEYLGADFDEDDKNSHIEVRGPFAIVPSLTPYRGDRCSCENCDWVGDSADCNSIANLHERVGAGEPMPVGECPKCGSLCHLV